MAVTGSGDVQEFSGIVEQIYDAAVDAALWESALERICGFVGGARSNIFYHATAPIEMVHFYAWGDDPALRKIFFEKYAALNPLLPAALFLEVGKVHTVPDLIPVEEFRQTRMYREWAGPQGIMDAIYANLERGATGASAIVVHRLERNGLFDDDARARFSLLVPHLRRAVNIGGILDFHKEKESALAAALDTLSPAVLLVTAEARLVHVNGKADGMLLAGELLRAPNGRLAAVDADAERQLREAIAAAAQGDADLGVKGIAIQLAASGGTSQVARVLPLTSGERRGMFDRRAAAAIFVHQIRAGVPAPLEVMTRLYGLTAGEVRVLAAVADISGVENMAAALGVSTATVKTQLQHLFAKTGVRRQSELIKLLTRHATTLHM